MTHSEAILEDPHLLLRESEWLQRLARSLCSDQSLAEDLAQDALLAAWERRGRLSGSLRPWLAGVLRRLAANRARGDARRRRRQARAVATGGTAPAADEVVARANLYRGVVDAVTELAEPYRTAILLRYFDDLPPRQIAARLDLPVETVRTRIKRGIALLRARLDGEHGARAAWLAPLSAITEWGTTSAGVGAATLASVVLMTMQLKILVPLVAVASLGALYFWPDAPVLDEGSNPGGRRNPAGVMKAPGQVGSAASATEPETSRTPLSVDVSTRVRGRLVRFADGEPVHGQEVLLMPPRRVWRIGADGQSRLELRDQRGVPPLARAVTDANGCFVLTVDDDDLGACEVRIDAEGYMEMNSRTVRPARGRTVDLGKCPLYGATRIAGRVRDTDGQPVPDLRIRLSWRGQEVGVGDDRFQMLFHLREREKLVTDSDGRFRTREPWPTGTYWTLFDDPSVALAQESRAFREVGPGAFLDLMVTRLDEHVAGTIVDHAGRPAAGLRVSTSHGGSRAMSKEDGSFLLRRRRGSLEEFGLVVWRDDFRLLDTTETFTWGQKDVRLVLPKGETLTLEILQAPGMRPVEAFDLSLQRVGDLSVYSRAMASGHHVRTHHPNGLVKLEGLLPGTYRVLVVQPDLSVEQRFEVARHQQSHRIVLPPRRSLEILVVDGRGEPVTGSVCELLQRTKADTDLALVPRRSGRTLGGVTWLSLPGRAMRLAAERTDGKGRAVLPVPDVEHLLLRIHGDGHAPVLLRGDLRPESGRLRIVVPGGARLAGRLRPPALARTLKPSLVLRSLDDPSVWFPDRFSLVPAGQATSQVQFDGSYCVEQVPPGSWEVHIFFVTRGRGGAGFFNQHLLTTVRDLKSGEARKLDLDVAHLEPARVRGQAMFGGKPAPLARLNLKSQKQRGLGSHAVFDADEHGRFQGSLVPGTYQVEAMVRDPETGEEIPCKYPGELTATAGAELSPTLDLMPARTRQAR